MARSSKPGSKVKSSARRAGRKKTASEKRSSKTPKSTALVSGSGQAIVRGFEAADTESYLRLRQSLDSFQAVALYYYTSGEDTEQRIARAAEIKTYLHAFTQQGMVGLAADSDCPPGTRTCSGGDCVPVFVGCVIEDDEAY
jgi:hypothetical protein